MNISDKKRKYKTYKERADYLSFINFTREEIYQAIAEFFGKDEIPPKMSKEHTCFYEGGSK